MSQDQKNNGYGQQPFEDDTISLVELFQALFRSTRLIAFVTVLVTAAMMMWVATRTPKYKAQATLLLESDESAGGVLSELASLTSDPAAEAELALIRSRSIAEVTVASKGEFDAEPRIFERTEPDFDPFAEVNQGGRAAPETGEVFDLGAEMDALGLTTIVERFDLRPSEGIQRKLQGGKVLDHRLRAELRLLPESGEELSEGLDVYFASEESVLIAPHERFLFSSPPSKAKGAVERNYESGVQIEAFGYSLKLSAAGDYVSKRYRVKAITETDAIKNLMESTSASESGRKTNVVNITVEDLSPQEAAEIANALAKNYIRRSILIGSKKAQRTSTFISRQLDIQQALLSRNEAELASLQSKYPEAISLSDSTKAVIDQITALELQKTQSELSLSATEQALGHLASGDDQAFARLSREAPNLIAASYFQELASLDAEISRARAEYPAGGSVVSSLEEGRAGLRGQIRANLASQAEGSKERLSDIEEKLDGLEGRLGGLPESQIYLAEAVRKVQTNAEIVGFLLRSQQEADIAAAATSATAVLIDPAIPDKTRVSPRATLLLAFSILLGLLAGCAVALIRRALQAALHTEAEVEAASGLPVLGAIPDFARGRARIKSPRGSDVLPMRDDPGGLQAEAYRSVRAALSQTMRGEDGLRTLACTSCVPGEGKTATNADLAIVFAKGGKKVLLVDCDLRKPKLHKLFAVEKSPGFGEVLEISTAWEDCVYSSGEENLFVMPAGHVNTNPGELLAGEEAGQLISELKSAYDLVVFDLPPAVAVADVANFATKIDSLLIVYRSGQVPGRVLSAVSSKLRNAGVNVLGVIMNAVYVSRASGSYGYGYGDKGAEDE
jgi:capsular exopolysaccharide synthesis family protein